MPMKIPIKIPITKKYKYEVHYICIACRHPTLHPHRPTFAPNNGTFTTIFEDQQFRLYTSFMTLEREYCTRTT